MPKQVIIITKLTIIITKLKIRIAKLFPAASKGRVYSSRVYKTLP